MGFVAFVDESGDHGLVNIDPDSPFFILTAALYHVESYLSNEIESLSRLIKHAFWSHEGVILRSYDIRKKQGPFSICTDSKTRDQLRAALCRAYDSSSCKIISSVINKPAHNEQYHHPVDPYEISIGFVLERVFLETRTACKFIFESRGKKEDGIVRDWFASIVGGSNALNKTLPFDINFARKQDNVIGLRMADMACHPILSHVQKGENDRPDWVAVRSCIRSSPQGVIQGWGLKVFP